MSEVDRLNRLLLEVRSSLLNKAERSPSSASRAAGKSQNQTPKDALTPLELRQGLVEGLRAIGPITDENRRRARKQFVQWVVLGEFGFELANDPSFAAICDNVLQAFSDNSDMSVRLDDLLANLTGGS